ncbi:MAG: hypothetical protein JJE22_15050 [Bacteroidia bacterium]|nr:hypothetical protein [Bacteroidia bacterium]
MSYINESHLEILQHEGLLGLSFYKNEINILETRLIEVAGKNTGLDASMEIEHFQNQIIVQRNNISELRHKINKQVQLMSRYILIYGDQIDNRHLEEDSLLIEEYKSLEKVIKELRHQFNDFLIKYM